MSHVGLNEAVNVYALCPAMDWHPIQGVFPNDSINSAHKLMEIWDGFYGFSSSGFA